MLSFLCCWGLDLVVMACFALILWVNALLGHKVAVLNKVKIGITYEAKMEPGNALVFYLI